MILDIFLVKIPLMLGIASLTAGAYFLALMRQIRQPIHKDTKNSMMDLLVGVSTGYSSTEADAGVYRISPEQLNTADARISKALGLKLKSSIAWLAGLRLASVRLEMLFMKELSKSVAANFCDRMENQNEAMEVIKQYEESLSNTLVDRFMYGFFISTVLAAFFPVLNMWFIALGCISIVWFILNGQRFYFVSPNGIKKCNRYVDFFGLSKSAVDRHVVHDRI